MLGWSQEGNSRIEGGMESGGEKLPRFKTPWVRVNEGLEYQFKQQPRQASQFLPVAQTQGSCTRGDYRAKKKQMLVLEGEAVNVYT